MKGHLSVAKAAKQIGICGSSLRNLIRDKKVFARRKGVGHSSPWYVPLAEVQRLEQAYKYGLANVS